MYYLKETLKKIVSFIINLLLILFISECSLRFILAIRVGPDILFYGTRFCKITVDEKWQREIPWEEFVRTKHNVSNHSNIKEGYSKYFPNQKRMDVDKNDILFNVTINSRGFRGKEFETEKPDGVLRICSLGTSPTFGYGNRDNETYSYYLEKILNENLDRFNDKKISSIEVINLGIPHLKAYNIYYLFLHEVIPLNADIVVFYAGMKDVTMQIQEFRDMEEMNKPSIKSKVKNVLKPYPEFKNILRALLNAYPEHLLTAKLSVRLFGFDRRPEFSRDFFYNLLEKRNQESFFYFLQLLKEECEKHNITFYVISQQAQSLILNDEEIKGVTYQKEVEQVIGKLSKGPITINELYFLTHSVLMRELKAWANENNVYFIDGIEILDQHREYILHWIHLMPEGNYILADGIAEKIIDTYNSK